MMTYTTDIQVLIAAWSGWGRLPRDGGHRRSRFLPKTSGGNRIENQTFGHVTRTFFCGLSINNLGNVWQFRGNVVSLQRESLRNCWRSAIDASLMALAESQFCQAKYH